VVPTVKSTSVNGKARTFAGASRNGGLGRQCGRVAARERASIPSRTHSRRHEGLERASRRDLQAQACRGRRNPQGDPRKGHSGLALPRDRSVCAHPMSFEPAQKAPFEGAPVSAGGVRVSSPGVGESRVARCGTSGAPSLLSKEERARCVERRNDERQRAQGSPLRRVRIELAEMCPCVVFENSLQKSKGFVRLKEASCVKQKARREREPRIGSHRRPEKAWWNRADPEKAKCPVTRRQNRANRASS